MVQLRLDDRRDPAFYSSAQNRVCSCQLQMLHSSVITTRLVGSLPICVGPILQATSTSSLSKAHVRTLVPVRNGDHESLGSGSARILAPHTPKAQRSGSVRVPEKEPDPASEVPFPRGRRRATAAA